MKLALIGIGQWGRNYLKTLATSQSDSVPYVITSKSLEDLAKIAPVKTNILSGLSQLHEVSGEIDGVIVATPPDVRPEYVTAILDMGLPVLAEKPLSLHPSETSRLVAKARAKQLFILEDFIHLFTDPFLALKDNVSPDIRNIMSCGASFGPFRDYSALMDYAPHDIAMSLILMKTEPTSMNIALEKYRDALSFGVTITLGFGNGAQSEISVSNINDSKVREFTVVDKSNEWKIDNLADEKLTENGSAKPVTVNGSTPLHNLLDQFSSRKCFYQQDQLMWLSEATSKVLARLEEQLIPQLPQHSG